MTNKYKISDFAKDFGITSKEVISTVKDITGEEKKSSAALNEFEVAILFDVITKNNAVKSFKEYFATGEESRAQAAKRRAEARDKKLADQLAILEQLKAAAQAAERLKKVMRRKIPKSLKKLKRKRNRPKSPKRKSRQ